MITEKHRAAAKIAASSILQNQSLEHDYLARIQIFDGTDVALVSSLHRLILAEIAAQDPSCDFTGETKYGIVMVAIWEMTELLTTDEYQDLRATVEVEHVVAGS